MAGVAKLTQRTSAPAPGGSCRSSRSVVSTATAPPSECPARRTRGGSQPRRPLPIARLQLCVPATGRAAGPSALACRNQRKHRETAAHFHATLDALQPPCSVSRTVLTHNNMPQDYRHTQCTARTCEQQRKAAATRSCKRSAPVRTSRRPRRHAKWYRLSIGTERARLRKPRCADGAACGGAQSWLVSRRVSEQREAASIIDARGALQRAVPTRCRPSCRVRCRPRRERFCP